MNDKIKVSVVTTCYNSERFLREAIESILSQTYRDFEYIIWNDGSTDSTEEIIKSYTDPRIRYFKGDNQGVGIAAKNACSFAKGKYIARLDADDISYPDRLEKEVSFLDTHPDYVLVSCLEEFMDEKGVVFGQSIQPCTDKALKKRKNIIHSGSMFRKEAYIKCGGYIGVRMGLDSILWGRMAKYGKYANLTEPLVKYRIQQKSIGRKLREPTYNKILVELMQKIITDEKVEKSDVDLYNLVWKINIDASKNMPDFETKSVINNKQQLLLNLLSFFLGKATAIKLLCILKSTLISASVLI